MYEYPSDSSLLVASMRSDLLAILSVLTNPIHVLQSFVKNFQNLLLAFEFQTIAGINALQDIWMFSSKRGKDIRQIGTNLILRHHLRLFCS